MLSHQVGLELPWFKQNQLQTSQFRII